MVVGATLFFVIVLGSKLQYLAEAAWLPGEDYVPTNLRAAAHGFRIPGGIVLLAIAMPVLCRRARLPWPQFGDRFVFVVATALVFVRLGCFLNGCCFGKVTSSPLGLSFPRESWVFFYHARHQYIPPTADVSLPVHPLQLYFVAATAGTLVVLNVLSRGYEPGELRLTFYGLFFASTMLLEPLRANHLTLNSWIVVSGTVISLLALMRLRRGVIPREALSG